MFKYDQLLKVTGENMNGSLADVGLTGRVIYVLDRWHYPVYRLQLDTQPVRYMSYPQDSLTAVSETVPAQEAR